MAACKGCGKPITWAVNPATGKRVPIDTKPTVYRVYTTSKGIVECVPEVPDLDESFGVSHFATCPKADEFSATSRGRPLSTP